MCTRAGRKKGLDWRGLVQRSYGLSDSRWRHHCLTTSFFACGATAGFFCATDLAAVDLEAPLTVRPASENLSELLSPIPLTRVCKSFQSLNWPFLRSSRIARDMVGPIPLMLSSAA